MANDEHAAAAGRVDDTASGMGDDELVRLFSAFDNVHASEQLKAATLERIFATADGEDAVPEAGPAGEDFPDMDGQGAASIMAAAGVDAVRPAKVVDYSAHKKRRRQGSVLARIAATILVVLLVAGTIAYALPISHVSVTSQDMTFELGVNVFGITVSASGNTDEAQAILDEVQVTGESFSSGIGRVMEALGERSAASGEGVEVDVDSPLSGQREQLESDSARAEQQYREHAEQSSASQEGGAGNNQKDEGSSSAEDGAPGGGNRGGADGGTAGRSGTSGETGTGAPDNPGVTDTQGPSGGQNGGSGSPSTPNGGSTGEGTEEPASGGGETRGAGQANSPGTPSTHPRQPSLSWACSNP